MGLNFIGSYCGRSLAAVSRKRRICGSVWVAQRAKKYSIKNISRPPNKLLSRLKVAAPRHMAKKKSFRSAPRIVRGRESERCTLFIRLAAAMRFSVRNVRESVAGKQPREKVHGGDGHTDTEQNAREYAFRATFTKGESKTGHHDCNEREPTRDGAGERRHENVDGVLPGGIAALRVRRSGKKQTDRDGREISRCLLERNSASPQFAHSNFLLRGTVFSRRIMESSRRVRGPEPP